MTELSKMCESCMMPLSKDERDGKAGLDPRYCSLCFVDGDFTAKGVTAKEFRDQTYQILKDQGWNRMIAWLATRSIPRAPRWKQADPDQV